MVLPIHGPSFHPREEGRNFQPEYHVGVKWNARTGRPPHMPNDFDLRRERDLRPEIAASVEVFYPWVQTSAGVDNRLEMERT